MNLLILVVDDEPDSKCCSGSSSGMISAPVGSHGVPPIPPPPHSSASPMQADADNRGLRLRADARERSMTSSQRLSINRRALLARTAAAMVAMPAIVRAQGGPFNSD